MLGQAQHQRVKLAAGERQAPVGTGRWPHEALKGEPQTIPQWRRSSASDFRYPQTSATLLLGHAANQAEQLSLIKSIVQCLVVTL